MDSFKTEKMSEVWSRVTGYADNCHTDEAEKICRFIDEAQRLSGFYSALAGKCRAMAPLFRQLSDEERGNVRQLQTAYFILTGDTCAVHEDAVRINSLLDALREAYLAENASADAYRKAAIESSDGNITNLFSMLADCESNHAVKLRDMISKFMN